MLAQLSGWIRRRIENLFRFDGELWVGITHRPWWHFPVAWSLRSSPFIQSQFAIPIHPMELGNAFSRAPELRGRIGRPFVVSPATVIAGVKYPDGHGGLAEIVHHVPPRRACIVEDAIVSPQDGAAFIVFRHLDGRLQAEALSAPHLMPRAISLDFFRRLPRLTGSGEDVVIPVVAQGNYNHWLTEEVTYLLSALVTLGRDTETRKAHILLAKQAPMMSEVLAAAGAPATTISSQPYVRVGPLLHIDRIQNVDLVKEDVARLRQLRDQILITRPARTSPSKIYVARFGGLRGMTFEHDLAQWLEEEWGFVVFAATSGSDASPPTLADQMGLFSQAQVIVGPHGAGLTNMVWAKPGAHVTEIAFPHYSPPALSLLAQVAGHSFDCCWVTSSTNDELALAEIRAQLEPMLSTRCEQSLRDT